MAASHSPDQQASRQALASIRFPALPARACSSYPVGPLAGTASSEKGWFALEQPGPWSRDILESSGLDKSFFKKLAKTIKQSSGYRLLFIRSPKIPQASSSKRRGAAGRRVFIAPGQQTDPALYTFTVKDPEELLSLPLHQPQAISGVENWAGRAVTLICTHAKRDQCCALSGRPLAQYLAQLRPEDSVWECSHLGGHRYAPTGLILPSAYIYGRLTPETALAATCKLEESQTPALEGLRGKSTLKAAEQAAEIAVRQLLLASGEEPGSGQLSCQQQKKQKPRPAAQDKKAAKKLTHIVVAHEDGRSWLVKTYREKTAPAPESCGKDQKPLSAIRVLSSTQLSE